MKRIKDRPAKDINRNCINSYESDDVVDYILKITNYLDTEYTKQQNHKYLLGDCILGKFNLLDKKKIRKNPYYISAKKFLVHIWESEAGWGQKIDETKKFDTQKEAEDFIKKYNKDLGKEVNAPSFYMFAKAANFTVLV